jgi:hypothetical protein
VFLYKEVLGQELEWRDNVERAKRPARAPVVLPEAEVRALLAQRDGRPASWRGSSTVPGSGSWSACACGSRRSTSGILSTVRDGKGEKDRITILSALLQANLLAHLERVKAVHQKDLEEGFGEVYSPFALGRKDRRAGREWG